MSTKIRPQGYKGKYDSFPPNTAVVTSLLKMWNPYIKLLFLLFIITTGISQSCNDYTSIIDEPQEYLRKSDLIVLLKSLEKLIQFTTSHIVNPSLDFVFGIFLISGKIPRVYFY